MNGDTNGRGHSELLTPRHCKEVWLPFLLENTLPPAES